MTVDRQLVKYKLLEEVGHGGMAVVFRGLDTTLNREVAVKILHNHLAEEEESKQRFQREAQAVAKLRHENIIEIYDYSGMDSPESYIVTEFIHGQTLKEYLSRHPISHPEIAAMIIVEICNALSHAHTLGIIHRDVKPENIMIRKDGRVKLTDFGIAQVVDVQRLTVTGQLLGSPAYMAPELVKGIRIDFRADIFSVGTLLYQLATSELPFKGKNAHEVLKRIAEGRYVDPEVANPVVGDQLARIIHRALAADPTDRYANIKQLQAALLKFLSEVKISDPRTELIEYFSCPADYSKKLQAQVVSVLTAHGKAALSERKTPQALQHFNRVLCTDPTNQEVLSILDQVNRRRRISRIIAVLLVIVALGSGAYLLSQHWPARLLVARPDTSTVASRGDDGGLHKDLATAFQTVPADSGSAARLKADALAPPPAPPLFRQMEIVPTPKAVTIWLNGRRLGAYGPDLRHVKLAARRKAKLVFRNDACCFEKVVILSPYQRPKVLRVKLPWKPARVKVVLTPEVKADILVGKLVTRPGEAVEVPIPAYSENGKGEVEVKVSAAGFATETRKVSIRANSMVNVPITLRRLP